MSLNIFLHIQVVQATPCEEKAKHNQKSQARSLLSSLLLLLQLLFESSPFCAISWRDVWWSLTILYQAALYPSFERQRISSSRTQRIIGWEDESMANIHTLPLNLYPEGTGSM